MILFIVALQTFFRIRNNVGCRSTEENESLRGVKKSAPRVVCTCNCFLSLTGRLPPYSAGMPAKKTPPAAPNSNFRPDKAPYDF